ncbi:MAG TPA: 5'-nucleotidase C-terminal domain-containing protein [Leptospiraceae bacterium]|nr:5'-nucleotidase C-terminal domain-containing protein [Leptospiraceae bacterium]HNN04258.1 5'-nucleotidase C-terminal domain-containing protein [Leptospiraceae bacterium]
MKFFISLIQKFTERDSSDLFFHYSVMMIFFFSAFCIQKKSPPSSAAATSLVTNTVSLGAPKSIGLDLVTNIKAWNRGCELRTGNLVADAFAWKANADIGFVNGGNIREDQNVPTILKGTVPDSTLFAKFMIFNNQVIVSEINGYRLKQALENSNRQLTLPRYSSATDDMDSDGSQHGNCYSFGSGSGRILFPSSNLSVDVNVSNTAMSVSGSAGSNNLKTNTVGARITRIVINGLMIYNNTSGSFTSGWAAGTSSCTVRQTSFTNSAACNKYKIATVDFQINGGDGNFSFNPSITANAAGPTEFQGDVPMSAAVINTPIGTDSGIAYEYVQSFTSGPVFPKIGNRLNLFH